MYRKFQLTFLRVLLDDIFKSYNKSHSGQFSFFFSSRYSFHTLFQFIMEVNFMSSLKQVSPVGYAILVSFITHITSSGVIR